MAGVTKVNPTAVALGTIQRNNAQTLYKVVLSNADDAVALTASTAVPVTNLLGSFAGTIQVISTGLEIFLIADRHAVDLNTVAITIGSLLDSSAGSVTSAGVYTCGGGGTVTVTQPTTFEGL